MARGVEFEAQESSLARLAEARALVSHQPRAPLPEWVAEQQWLRVHEVSRRLRYHRHTFFRAAIRRATSTYAERRNHSAYVGGCGMAARLARRHQSVGLLERRHLKRTFQESNRDDLRVCESSEGVPAGSHQQSSRFPSSSSMLSRSRVVVL